MDGKRVLLIVGGGIAAYKVLDLVRRLRERGVSVRTVLTQAGAQFVTPLSLASLSGNPVHTDLFSLTDEAQMGHIELSRSADLVVVAPATADLLAKAANGLANDLASTLLLATDKRVLMVPAMNVRMWQHPATQRNVAQLQRDGILFVGPDDGAMAFGEFGPGRMSEVLDIVVAIDAAFRMQARAQQQQAPGILAGKRVIITSGPTYEPIDPVRYIANRSSGKQGHAIAEAAARAGADVLLVCGPVAIPDPAGVTCVHVESAREMLAAVEAGLPADIYIGAAAVADWRVGTAVVEKLKKGASGPPSLGLVENPDILATISTHQQRPALVVGFAAETQTVVEHARAKLTKKKCDLIIANDVSAQSGVMGGDENTVHLVSKSGVDHWPRMAKTAVAQRLVEHLAKLLKEGV